RLAARFADAFNAPFRTPDETKVSVDRVREACGEAGRESIRLSAPQVVCAGRAEAESARRAPAIGRHVAQPRANGLGRTPPQVVGKIGRFADLGAERIYLQVLDLTDLEHLELLAAEVLPHV